MQHGVNLARSDGTHRYVKVAVDGLHKNKGCPTCNRQERESERQARKEQATA